jgi:hypothetical protein
MVPNTRSYGSPYLNTLQDANPYLDTARTNATQSSSSQTSKYQTFILAMFLLQSKAKTPYRVAHTTAIHR